MIFIIINWSSVDLERVFAGLTRSQKVTGNKRYYEYRRNLLPYMIWIQDNLDYDALKELTSDYSKYIKEVKLGTDFVQSNEKLIKPPKKWWKELTAAKGKQGFMQLIDQIPKKDDSMGSQRIFDKFINGVNSPPLVAMLHPDRFSEPAIDFLIFMWDELGPLNLLYWVKHNMPSWGYNAHRRNITNMWPSTRIRSTNYPTPPWTTRIKIAALQNPHSMQKRKDKLEEKFIEGYSLHDWIADGSPSPPHSSLGSSYNDLIMYRRASLPTYPEVLGFWTQFFSKYYQGVEDRNKYYEKWSTIMNAYNSFNPEVSKYLENGLVDIDKAFQIIDSVRMTQPEVSRIGSGDLNRRKSVLPKEYDFHKFIKLTKELGFNPELPTLAIELCSKCDGAGGSDSDAKIRVCSTCKGLGVDIAGRGSRGITKLYYPSAEVSSHNKIVDMRRSVGSLLRSNDNQHSRNLNYLQQQIEEALELLESLTPNYK